MRARMIAFYIVDLSTKTSRNALFVDSIDSIIEKTVVMMRNTIKIEEKAGLKRCFGTFLSFLV
jgi:malate synthase